MKRAALLLLAFATGLAVRAGEAKDDWKPATPFGLSVECLGSSFDRPVDAIHGSCRYDHWRMAIRYRVSNPTDAPLFVMTRVYEDGGNTMLEVSLIGEPLAARYALESQSRETGTIEEPVYVRDRDGQYATYTDERVPVSDAQPGYAATVERITLDEGGTELARETVSEDTYDALAPVIYVGVNPREP